MVRDPTGTVHVRDLRRVPRRRRPSRPPGWPIAEALGERADDLLAEKVAGIPLVHEQQRFAHRAEVRGIPADPLEHEFLTREVTLG